LDSPARRRQTLLFSTNKDRLLDARLVSDRLQGLATGHGKDWLFPAAATPGAANSFNFHDEIVINEIMYHAMPQQPTAGTTTTTKLLSIDVSTLWRYNQKGTDLGSTWAQSALSGRREWFRARTAGVRERLTAISHSHDAR
jgi:hypothetical protein